MSSTDNTVLYNHGTDITWYHVWHKYTEWPPKDLENYKGNATQCKYYKYPKLQSISLGGQSFLSYKPFRDQNTEWLCTLSDQWYTIYVVLELPKSQLSLFGWKKVYCENLIFGKIASAPNDPKMTLNTMRTKISPRAPRYLPFSFFHLPQCQLSILLLTTLTSGPNLCMIVAENAAPANNRR